ncbi:NAD+ synthase (glutamine-hydrolysing) [Rhizoctonia solani AG-1 IB]|uniref:NAD+ synthase (Glutamine-hydrolysing) n=1 Tax=Thanatephorus cucumeris (strain AG1-IB / isolate 7/3/14) TaxID=1108050 RepID=M5BUF4_THACB|nr:NAD+ synthase (glutamine-hydrolysing) [Rhizoctonia solani AG-1 IB]
MQAAEAQRYPRIEVPMPLSGTDDFTLLNTAAIQKFEVRYHTPEEEIALGPACWLWDYLRRSRTQGYFVPLSGGIDSCATAVIVYSMSRLVSEAANKGDTQVIADARRICGEPETSTPKDAPHASVNALIMMVIHLADINPIGGISKTDLKKFIRYAQDSFDLPILNSFLDAIPTAELEPITESYVQADEADMGMTYDELSVFGRLRKVEKCGPYSTFCKLIQEWGSMLSPTQVRIADKVKLFFFEHARNRHKMTTLTPSYHAESYSPDDNRFDLRPFLYNARFPFQFAKIDEIAKKLPDRSTVQDEARKAD